MDGRPRWELRYAVMHYNCRNFPNWEGEWFSLGWLGFFMRTGSRATTKIGAETTVAPAGVMLGVRAWPARRPEVVLHVGSEPVRRRYLQG